MQDHRAQTEYHKGAELGLLTKLLGRLENKTVVDLAAARGDFVRALLDAGAEAIYAFEPSPSSVTALRSAFTETPTVHVFDLDVGERDERVPLGLVADESDPGASAFQTLGKFAEAS